MKSPLLPLGAALIFFSFAGCATAPSHPERAKGPTPPVVPSASIPGTGAPARAPAADEVLPEGEYRLRIESTPDEAMVVVNGIPVGKTPRTIELAGTSKGFFRDQVSVKVRFIALDAAHASQTVEELLTPLDRIPAIIRFTPAGTTRVAR
jgi:hypothetical protein